MRVAVLLFAVAREAAGRGSMTIDLAAGATLADALSALGAASPELAAVLPNCRAAVDEEFANADTPLRDGATVAILPPVSGG